MQTDEISVKLAEVVKKIACPLKAASVCGNEVFCSAKVNLVKGSLTKEISLGDIEQDILDNCTACKLKNFGSLEPKEIYIEKAVSTDGELICAANGKCITQTNCAGCVFLNAEKTMEFFKGQDENTPVTRIACGFPRITSERAKIFLTNEQKKLKRPD